MSTDEQSVTFPWTLPAQMVAEMPAEMQDELPPEMKRPTVPVVLLGPGGTAEVDLLIDSGCSHSLLSAGLLDRLGISESDCVESQPVDFIGGGVRTLQYRPGVTGRVAGRWDLRLEGRFAVAGSVPFASFDDGLLGRDVLAATRVTFDGQAATTTLEPYPEVAR